MVVDPMTLSCQYCQSVAVGVVCTLYLLLCDSMLRVCVACHVWLMLLTLHVSDTVLACPIFCVCPMVSKHMLQSDSLLAWCGVLSTTIFPLASMVLSGFSD